MENSSTGFSRMVRRLAEDSLEKRREAFFKRVEEEGKLPLPMVVEEEVEWAKEVTDSKKGFWCPIGHHPLFCDGYLCESGVYGECMEFLKAYMLLRKVAKGEIRVRWRTMKVRL